MIKAPYNFVPLTDKVFFPDWADQISQDVPFFDGISGTIELKITAKTPIFVRNGHKKEDAENKNDEYKSFSKAPDGRYFIPATSIKGCIRNVLEIMSFGKLRLDQNIQYAQREWDNPDLFKIKSPTEQNNMHCGWLKINGNGREYEIIDCGKPMRIAHTRIDEYLGEPVFENHFSKTKGVDLTKEQEINGHKFDPKCAVYKYKLIGNRNLDGLYFTKDEEFAVKYKENRVMVSDDGILKGTIVLTGQPDKWKFPRPQKMTPNAGKFYEFVFLSPDKNAKKHIISEEEFNHYKFIYADSPDWKFASTNIYTSGIPVFFRLENGKIKDWGLSFLYKLPYEKTPYETLYDAYRSEKPDMAGCIFGYTSKKKSLKGRVQFSAFWSSNADKDEKYTLVLSSPKASYYPIYINQDDNGKDGKIKNNCTYKTYNDGGVKGWKRYHVRNEVWESRTGDEQIDTVIYPLKKDSEFTGKIMFHNLKPEELGALLSALTFHNQTQCFHQIGMAKPYGFGKVSLDILNTNFVCGDNIDLSSQNNPLFYMALFEKMMNVHVGGQWITTDSIRQFVTLANKEVVDDTNFNYMALDVEHGNNEFANAKKEKSYLQYYCQLTGIVDIIKPLLSGFQNDVDKIEEAKKGRIDNINKAIAEQVRLEEERKRQEEEKARQEEERIRQEIEKEKEKEQEARKLQKIQAGLSFLEETYEDGAKVGSYKVVDFNGAKNRIGQWLKKASKKNIGEDQFYILETSLIRLAANPAKKEQKDWIHRESKLWKYVESITSEEFAGKIFNKINL